MGRGLALVNKYQLWAPVSPCSYACFDAGQFMSR